jgi:6-phosphogluconolactonase
MRRMIDYGERGQVTVAESAKDVAFLAVEEIAVVALRAMQRQTPAFVALSGGSTPKRMYEVLKDPRFHRRFDWKSLQFFWGDERWVPIEDEASNAGEALRGFIEDVDLPEDNWHPWPTQLDDPDDAAAAYEMTIRIVTGSPEALPELDLVFLGMGDDGHTASLFPGTEAIHEAQRLCVANPVPKLDTTRLTFTPRLIDNADEVVFLVTGEGKAEMLHKVLDRSIDVDTLPSQIIRPTHGRLRWLVDEAAAARLEKG